MASRFSINVQDYIFTSEEFEEFSDEHKKFLVAFFREKAYTTPKYFEIRNRRNILHTTPKSMRHFVRYYKNQYQNMCPYYSTGEKLGISPNKLMKCRKENTLKTLVSCRGHLFINKDELTELRDASVIANTGNQEECEPDVQQTSNLPTSHTQALAQGYVSAPSFCKKHGISYQVFLRQLQNNLFPSLVINDRYYVPEDIQYVNYIRLTDYARLYGLSYSTVSNAANNGAFKTIRKLGRYRILDKDEPLPDVLKK